MIKILYFHPTVVFGGAERATTKILKGIDRSIFDVTFVTKKGIFRDIPVDKIVYIDDIGIGDSFKGILALIRDIRLMQGVVRRESPDLVFGMLHYGCMVLSWMKFFFGDRIRVVISPRTPSKDAIDFYFRGSLQKKGLWNFMVYFFCTYADHIVVPCLGMRDECISVYKADKDKVTAIRNSVEKEEIMERANEAFPIDKDGDFFVVSTSSRLSSEKNIPVLIRAFVLLRKSHKCKLWIVGDGPEKPSLEEMIKEYGIEQDVVFWGFQDNPYKIIKRSDVFVHLSMFEGFANMIWEVMACKVPVIATDCNYGPREAIRNMASGILVPVSDEIALMNALETVLNDRGLQKKFIEEAYADLIEYSNDAMVRQFEEIFRNLHIIKPIAHHIN